MPSDMWLLTGRSSRMDLRDHGEKSFVCKNLRPKGGERAGRKMCSFADHTIVVNFYMRSVIHCASCP